MFFESAMIVGVACVVLTIAYFLDSYQAKLFRQPRPSPAERTRK